MSAHFDGGAQIAGRRLREVEVMYVDDPTLDMSAEDSDDCPASPPPTYYLRVREERKKKGPTPQERMDGRVQEGDSLQQDDGINGNRTTRPKSLEKQQKQQQKKKQQAWSWRYVNVEKKALLVWDRRGGRLMRSIPLKNVESLSVLPDKDSPASILEVHISSSPSTAGSNSNGNDNGNANATTATDGDDQSLEDRASASEGGVLVLQARSRRETLLWAKVLQENVEIMTKRLIPLENLDAETNLSDVQQLAKLLTHQLSELQQTSDSADQQLQRESRQKQAPKQCWTDVSSGANGSIPETVDENDAEEGTSA